MLVNRGDGRFQAKLDYAPGGRPYSVAIGDLNSDGRPDLVTANEGVSVFLNTPGLCTVQNVKRRAGTFAVDDLKVWNYAKTRYADRFLATRSTGKLS